MSYELRWIISTESYHQYKYETRGLARKVEELQSYVKWYDSWSRQWGFL